MSAPFQVDLHGIVDLLSHHLYSSPRVYLRELLQNAVDAVNARRGDPEEYAAAGSPDLIRIVPADRSPDGCLHIEDCGIGLTRDDIDTVLATIGNSSKRTPDGLPQEGFIGQFGIGLLSCFLVADTIELTTRRVGSASTWRWIAHSSGTYLVEEAPAREAPGSLVSLRPRPGLAHLLGEAEVRLLIEDFARFLPFRIVLVGRDGEVACAGRRFPWDEAPHPTSLARRAATADLCDELLGFSPLDSLDLHDPQTGLHGIAYVLPYVADRRGSHRVYSHRMLVGETTSNILPPWAVFVRAVVDVTSLRLTASRESLYEDAALHGLRERLGAQLLAWLTRMAQTDPRRIRTFLDIHHMTIKQLACDNDELLDAISPWLTFDSTTGPVSLVTLGEEQPVLRYAASVDDFRQLAPFEQAHGSTVINAGFAFDRTLIRRYAARHDLDTQAVRPTSLLAGMHTLDPAEEAACLPLLDLAARILDRSGCEIVVRRFEPETVPALVLSDGDTRRSSAHVESLAAADGVWADLLRGLTRHVQQPQFVLNAANPSIQSLLKCEDISVQTAVVEALYAHALLNGHHVMRPYDNALVGRALPKLIERALHPEEGR